MNGNGRKAVAVAAAIVVIFLGLVFQQIRDARSEALATRAICDERHDQTLEIRGDLKEIRAELRGLRVEVHGLRGDLTRMRDAMRR